MSVRDHLALADPHSILDEYLPEMLDLLDRPHHDHATEWMRLRNRVDELFADNGWDADEGRVAFALLVAFAERTSSDARPGGDS